MFVYTLTLNGQDWGHCYSFEAALHWKNRQVAAGADPCRTFIGRRKFPKRVSIYGPLEPA